MLIKTNDNLVKKALKLLKSKKLPENIILHSQAVFKKALEIANKIKDKGIDINLNIVKLGSLLHDIGRVKTHGLDHGYVGGLIILENGLDYKVARIAQTHVLGGFKPNEAEKIGLPKKDFTPQTLEEKICCYADKLVYNTTPVTLEERFKIWINKHGSSQLLLNAFNRVKKIESKIKTILNDC